MDERPETMDYKTELVKFSAAIARGVGRTLLTVSKARRYVGPQPKAKAQSQSAAARKTTADLRSCWELIWRHDEPFGHGPSALLLEQHVRFQLKRLSHCPDE